MTGHSSPYSPFSGPTQNDTRQAADARLRAAQERATVLLDLYGNAQILGGQPELADLSAAEIESMPLREFARLRARAGLADSSPTYVADDTPAGPPAGATMHEAYTNDVPDFGEMTMTDYAALRAHYIRPSSNRGLFDQEQK